MASSVTAAMFTQRATTPQSPDHISRLARSTREDPTGRPLEGGPSPSGEGRRLTIHPVAESLRR